MIIYLIKMLNIILEQFMKDFKYKYLSLIGVSLIIAAYLAGNQSFHNFLLQLGSLEYVGALIAGVLFVSTFTVAESIVIISILSTNINPVALGLIGGIGAVVGDLIIFRLVKDHLTEELKLLLPKQEIAYIKSVLKSKYIAWMLPFIGMLIIASPLPDELGVSVLGLSKISETKFIIISFICNAVGILMVAAVAKVI